MRLTIALPGQLESTFIEIDQKKGKNIICGCIYGHHSMSVFDFNENYLSSLLDKISKENKKSILMGDFNINLLDLDRKTNVSNFHNLLPSHMFSPFILQPTRVTQKSATVIGNIFVNLLEPYTHSGNITTKISDHLLQFLVLRINIKKNILKKTTYMLEPFSFLI